MFNKSQWITLIIVSLIATGIKVIFPNYSILDLILMLSVSSFGTYFFNKNQKKNEYNQ